MTAMKSSEVLEREHEVIQKVIATMSVVADRLDAGHSAETATLRDISTFLHEFPEQCHHAKEERFLFHLLEARGVPASGCPIAVLHHQHEKGRALLTQLDDAIQALLASRAANDAAGHRASRRSGTRRARPERVWNHSRISLSCCQRLTPNRYVPK